MISLSLQSFKQYEKEGYWMDKKSLVAFMKENEGKYVEVSSKIWKNPQIGFNETFASQLQKEVLQQAGFQIQSNIGDVETAFIAQFGNGSPIIGILGEFDALPGLSQQIDPTFNPVEANGPGHGCGHNLLGTAGVEAVISTKKYMEENNIQGTIRYYGCPAEELLSGKTYMARAGAFDDLDLVYTWHPGNFGMTTNLSMQALSSVEYFFKGRTAHAAAAPHLGRSALDAVELTNVGANYLREHVPDGSRIHYQITNGGLAPNVVPEDASVLYFLRGKNRAEVDDLLRRLNLVANGAAMMTETSVTSQITAGCYDTLPNMTLNEVMYENAQLLPEIEYSAEEEQFAKTLEENIDPAVVASTKANIGQFGGDASQPLIRGFKHIPQLFRMSMPGSSDIGDVSWITPMGQVIAPCSTASVQLHTWQATAVFGSSIGMKGMHMAAQIMALSTIDALEKPEIIEKAKQEFEKNSAGIAYKSAIPDDVHPPKPEFV